MKNKNRFLLSLVTLAISAYGFAQDNDKNKNKNKAKAKEGAVEVILVSAQKREQYINDVPITMNAFSAKELERYDVGKPEDIKFLVPGLDIYNNVEAGGLSVSLRGMSIFTFTPTSDPAAAVYVDEAYMASLAQVGFQSFDMAAVEVLKGPQGTLFGRNTPAGLIHFKTKRPTRESEAYVKAEAGDYGAFAIEGVVSGAISEKVAGRFSVRNSYFDGYFENRLDGNKNTGGVDSSSIRGQLLYEGEDNSEVLLSVHYDSFDGTSTPFFSRGLIDPQGGLCATFLPLVANGGGDGDAFRQAFDGASARGCTDYAGFNEPDTDPFTVSVDSTFGKSGKREGEAFGVHLKASFDLTDTIGFTSLTSYEYDDQFWQAIQFSPLAGAADLPQASDVSAFSQEIRLSGGTDDIDWVTGAFLSYDTITFDIINSLVFDLRYSLYSQQKTLSTALFGNVDYHLNDEWILSAGLRASHEKRQGIVDVDSSDYLPETGGFKVDKEALTNDLSGKVGLSYQPEDDYLFYASVSTGFKSPGINTGFVLSEIEVGPTEKETIVALEAGTKLTLLDGRMQANFAVYHYDRKDAQGVDFIANDSPVPQQGLTNFGDAKLSGVEVDLRWNPVDNLSLIAGLSMQDTEVTSGTYKGNDLPGAPEVTATFMARYEISLGDWSLNPQVDARYVDERHRFIGNKLSISEIDGVALNGQITDLEPGYWQLNAGAELVSADRKWVFTGKVANILDEAEYISYPFYNEVTSLSVGEPRNIKFTATYNF